MNNYRARHVAIIVITLALASSSALAQKTKKDAVDERNVRAELGFLASDAMQGRGSAGPYERVAAEYIGSQFMQFGLEPAGEPGWDGKPSFVQTVSFSRNTFDGPLMLKFGSTVLSNGKEFVTLRANGAAIGGPLQKLSVGGTVKPGSAVLITNTFATDTNALFQELGRVGAGASVIMAVESEPVRGNWGNLASRRLSFTSTGAGKPVAVVILSKDAAAAISALPEGTQIDFAGQLAPVTPQNTWNAIGKLTGSDPTLSSEVILLSSHLDHLGVRANAPGDDKIYNGADDDASGSVAVLEMARVLSSGKRPKRTVYFVCFGSEEAGGYGASYFVNNMPFPKEKLVANLEFEMIGRADAAVKPDELWLTGYERSNLGPELAKRGAKLVQDPHPEQNFFQRSDNIQLARQGIIAHTVSSFGLHKEYHQASDELKMIDFTHMTHAINSMVDPVKWLVNTDFKPTWNEGKKP